MLATNCADDMPLSDGHARHAGRGSNRRITDHSQSCLHANHALNATRLHVVAALGWDARLQPDGTVNPRAKLELRFYQTLPFGGAQVNSRAVTLARAHATVSSPEENSTSQWPRLASATSTLVRAG